MSELKVDLPILTRFGTTLLSAAFIAILPVWAQLSPTPSQSVYEGQTLSSVSLIANPRRDVESLKSLVSQKEGQPFSETNINASLVALAKEGGFDDVKAEIVSNTSGLHLNFILEAPYYVGMIEFRGIAKHSSYAQLLKVVSFSGEDPYNKAAVPDSAAALTRFFQKDGYLQAETRANANIDDLNHLVNLEFVVHLGKRATIRSVEVQGPSEQESLKLVQSLRSTRARFTGAQMKSGKPYTADREKSATAFIRRDLVRQHHLANKVESDSQLNVESNLIDVFFRADPGPFVNIRVSGARLSLIPLVSRREVRKLLPIYSESTIDQDLVEEGERNLIEYFKRKGFFDVEVRTRSTMSPEQISILYEVKRGKKHKLDNITFRGAHCVSEKELLSHVVLRQSRAFSHGSITQKLLMQSTDNLRALYKDRGYEKVQITPRVNERESRVSVTFEIEEGPRTLVDSVLVTGNDHILQSQLVGSDTLRLLPGMPFSEARLLEDRHRIEAGYLNAGYLNAEVNATVRRDPDNPQSVDVTYAITEGQLVRVSRVAYLGQQQTRVSMIKEITQIQAEAPMKRGALLEAESRLYALNIFDWSSVSPQRPITDQSEEGALIRVHESKRNEISYGFGFAISHRGGSVPAGSVPVPGLPPVDLQNNKVAPSEAMYAGPLVSIEFSRRNMRGLADSASALLSFSRLNQQLVLTYGQPRVAGSKWSSLTSFALQRTTENPLYAAALGNASFQVERLLDQKTNTRIQLRYNFNRTYLSDLLVPELVLPQDRNVWLSTISGSYIRDTRDAPLDAHHGSFATLNLGLTPGVLGSSATFAKLFGQYSFQKSVNSLVFANAVRLGLSKAIAGSFVPTSELFFSGGGTSLRSFPINQAGPQRIVPFCNVLEGESGCVDVTVPVGGRQLFILNSELRFPLRIKKGLGGVLFYDGGNVYRAINLKDFVRNYTNTVGFGLRYATPIGPIRIDVGHNLNPVPGIHSTQYYITLGQAF